MRRLRDMGLQLLNLRPTLTHYESIDRMLDILRLCQTEQGEGFLDLQVFVASLMTGQTAPRTNDCYEKRFRIMATAMNSRRVRLFLMLLKYLGVKGRSRQSVIDAINDMEPTATTEQCLKLLLTPPGTDTFATWDEASKSICPIHEREYFRPSIRCFFGEHDPTKQLEPSQNAMATEQERERLRISLFADERMKAYWFFFDCFVLTTRHAQVIAGHISRQYQRYEPGAPPWCPDTINDFVRIFWMAKYFINSAIRQLSGNLGGKTKREESKSIMKGVTHAALPYMVFDLTAKYGMDNQATQGFRSTTQKMPASSQFQRVAVFGIASLGMYQRSKVPIIVGGSAFYDTVAKPIMDNFLRQLMEVTDATNVGRSSNRDVSAVLSRMEKGEMVLPNIVVSLYEAVLREMPACVDRARGVVSSGVEEVVCSDIQEGTEAEMDSTQAGDAAPSCNSMNNQVDSETMAEGVSGKVNAKKVANKVKLVHSYLDNLLDEGIRYSPQTVLIQIGIVTGYDGVDALRETFRDFGMRSDPEEDSSSEDDDASSWANNRKTTMGHVGLLVSSKEVRIEEHSRVNKRKEKDSHSKELESNNNKMEHLPQRGRVQVDNGCSEESESEEKESSSESSESKNHLPLITYQRRVVEEELDTSDKSKEASKEEHLWQKRRGVLAAQSGGKQISTIQKRKEHSQRDPNKQKRTKHQQGSVQSCTQTENDAPSQYQTPSSPNLSKSTIDFTSEEEFDD